ncbi:hypothetical protein JCM11491_004999 [Sporobolomyces phaffii]
MRIRQLVPALVFGSSTARAHMSPFLSAMYGGPLDYPGLQNPVAPLGPGLEFDDWWFRGPAVRNAPPKDGQVAVLPAGGDFTLEIACAPEYTTYDGSDPNGNVACDEPGPYHADPDALVVRKGLLSGCAIGIADVMDPNDATMDDFTIISVQKDCVWTRNTTFSIPARMPKCTGDWCICGWVWSPQTGIANAYHTPFRCKIDGSPADARPIAPPQDPVYCPESRSHCTKGAKKLISTYNYPVNVPFTSNYDRPGYHETFGFFDGPQDDIFLPQETSSSSTTPEPTASHSPSSSSTRSASSSTTAVASSSASSSPSIPKIVWTLVPTTTPRWAAVPTSTRFSTVTTSARSSAMASTHRIPYRERTTTTTPAIPIRTPRLPFASRLSLLPVTTISPSVSRPQATRKTFRERQAEIEVSFEKKARSHSTTTNRKRKRNFGASTSESSGGMADRLVARMRKVVTHEKRARPPPETFEEVGEKLVWTRVEL